MLAEMYVEKTGKSKMINTAKRTIVDITEDDEFFDEKERFVGKVVVPHNVHKWKDGTYGFECDIEGMGHYYFHSVKLNKGFR